MKVIFLDFDGVVLPFGHTNAQTKVIINFSPACKEHLSKIIDAVPEAKIVISSAWRKWGIDTLRKIFDENQLNSKKVIDVTGNENGDRGYQIQCWMDRNPGVEAFVIIDDNSDMGELVSKLVKTNSFVGLTSKNADQAISILKEK